MTFIEQIINFIFSLFTPTAILAFLLSLVGVAGCANQEREAQIATFKEVTLFAKEMGVAGQAHMNIGGAPSFDMRTGGVLDTGITANVTLQFNALADPRGKAETAVGEQPTGVMVESNEHPTATE